MSAPNVSYDHPDAKLWSVYVTEAEKEDKALSESWQRDMDAILIFSGLFSATVTAFIIESYKSLKPDPAESTALLLARISQQLAGVNNVTSSTSNTDDYQPSTSAVVCNFFWLLSLTSSLTCALSATLVQQWGRCYLQATERRLAPYIRARIRAYLFGGLQTFQMSAAVELIPMLLHISLLLFFAGLVEFFRPFGFLLSFMLLVVVVIGTGVYIMLTVFPLLYPHCPYQTPFSDVSLHLLQGFCWLPEYLRRIYHVWDKSWTPHHVDPIRPIPTNLAFIREQVAMSYSPDRSQRDTAALKWAMESLTDISQFVSFLEGVPGFLSGSRDDNAQIIQSLFEHHRLRSRIAELLATCGAGILTADQRQQRAITCLSALWAIMKASMIQGMSSSSTGAHFWFPYWHFSQLLPHLYLLSTDPALFNYAISAISAGLWIWFHDLANDLNRLLGDLSDERETSGSGNNCQLVRSYLSWKLGDMKLELPDTLTRVMQALQKARGLISGFSVDDAAELTDVVRRFKAYMMDAHYYLLVDFCDITLTRQMPPHEALATIHFFRQSLPSDPPESSVQSHLATLLCNTTQSSLQYGSLGYISKSKLPDKTLETLLPLAELVSDSEILSNHKLKAVVSQSDMHAGLQQRA